MYMCVDARERERKKSVCMHIYYLCTVGWLGNVHNDLLTEPLETFAKSLVCNCWIVPCCRY